MNKKIFITYGDDRYLRSRDCLAKEAEQLNLFDEIIVETPESIEKDSIFQKALDSKPFREVYSNKKKGGGYWVWKPYIIYKRLQLANSNDIIFYTDGGSTIPNNKRTINKLNEFIRVVNKSSRGVIGFQCCGTERRWTKGDVFEYFNVLNSKDIYNAGQFQAGKLQVSRKCPHSLSIYKKWWTTAAAQPHLFDDSPSKISNFPDFKEARHDQSVWSLICKTMGVEKIPYPNLSNPIRRRRPPLRG